MKVIHINLSKTWRGGERQVILLMQGLTEKNVEQISVNVTYIEEHKSESLSSRLRMI